MTHASARRCRLVAAAVVPLLLLGVPAAASAASPTTVSPPPIPHGTPGERLHSLLGLFVLIGLAWLVGRMRGARGTLRLRPLFWGVALQFAFGALVVLNPKVLAAITAAVDALLGFAGKGAGIVFGDLATPAGPAVVDAAGHPIGHAARAGYFAFFVLPTIIFFSCLTAVAYFTGVMPYVIHGLAWVMARTMKCSGAETLCTAANIFVGQAEAPLMVKPFVEAATNSELMAMMTIGFANIASGVLALYSVWLAPYLPTAAGHLAAACFIPAPGSLLVAKLIVPETGTPVTADGVRFQVRRMDANLIDAAARGTADGLTLALTVAAMLITFTALVAFADALLGWAGDQLHLPVRLSIELVLGYLFRPLAWLTGVSWAESRRVGSLLGVKTVLTELVAYQQMTGDLARDPTYLSPRAVLLTTYSLCGFANFASVGIQVGGIATIAPTRRADLSRLGLLALTGGALASLMAACVVGVLV